MLAKVNRNGLRERDDDQQHCFLMDMIAKKKACESTSGDAGEKQTVRRLDKHLEHRQLRLAVLLAGRDTSCAMRVMTNVIRDVISGRTPKDVSPTRPLVKLDTAPSFLISNPSVGATTN
jgi:hypothetical protein